MIDIENGIAIMIVITEIGGDNARTSTASSDMVGRATPGLDILK